MIRLRLGALLASAVVLGACVHAPKAMAAAEVHHLNLVVSAIPSQLNGGGMNDLLSRYNEYPLGSTIEPLSKISMGWLFDAELRYFVRPNFALAAGVGHLRTDTKREIQPSIGSDIVVRGEVLAVPLHVGALYYMAPYTQGDFQARAFVGAGVLSVTTGRALFTTFEQGLTTRGDTLDNLSLGGDNRLVGRGDSPGYYAEVGAHMFFATRFSLLVGAIYRSAVIRDLANDGIIMVPYQVRGSTPPVYLQGPLLDANKKPVRIPSMDLSGLGVRMALGIGL